MKYALEKNGAQHGFPTPDPVSPSPVNVILLYTYSTVSLACRVAAGQETGRMEEWKTQRRALRKSC